ncbi:methyltransferase [Amaricoccus macauensis]|uniref:methyltransferase n=1 Tax=Amaricoccus macauensis TaxID=57001 RepID=UPI003C7B7ECE
MLQLAIAYKGSRALHVATRLGIPDLLVGEPKSAEDLAPLVKTPVETLQRLLRALAAYDVVNETSDGRFTIGRLGACVRSGGSNAVRDLVLMFGHDDYWQTWGELGNCVSTGDHAAKLLFGVDNPFARYSADPEVGPVFNRGMVAMSAYISPAVIEAYDFSKVSCVVDVAGGRGRLIADVLDAVPHLEGKLLDLPATRGGAEELLTATGVRERCEIISGDMFADIPEGGDLYMMKTVLHDWDDEKSIAILSKCREAMSARPNARLLIVEQILPERVTPGFDAQMHVLADLNMMVRTGGFERTEAAFSELLEKAGMELVQVIPTRSFFSLLEARPV